MPRAAHPIIVTDPKNRTRYYPSRNDAMRETGICQTSLERFLTKGFCKQGKFKGFRFDFVNRNDK